MVAEDDAIAGRLADQSARDGRDVADRSRWGSASSSPTIMEHHRAGRRRGRMSPGNQTRPCARSTGSGISCAGPETLRRNTAYPLMTAASRVAALVEVFDLLRRVDTRRERPPSPQSSAFSPDCVARIRVRRDRTIGKSTAAAVSALSSRVNATLMAALYAVGRGRAIPSCRRRRGNRRCREPNTARRNDPSDCGSRAQRQPAGDTTAVVYPLRL